MSNFEFVFSLLVILLGLGLGQVLSGLAKAVNQRPAISIGWGTGLLAIWVMAETVIFWRIIWRAHDTLPDTTPALYAGFLITALYFFAGALVFPDDPDDYRTLDDHFMQQKAKVIGAVLAAIALALALRPAVMGIDSWAVLTWWDWGALATIYSAGTVAMTTRRREVAVACLAVLVVLDLLEPFAAAIWTS